jgi:hypothetical protein
MNTSTTNPDANEEIKLAKERGQLIKEKSTMNEYRKTEVEDIKIEQEPSVGGDGEIHLTIRDYPMMVLCGEEIENLKIAITNFLVSAPTS